jgi:CheY-like chemotaxis protein
MKNGKRKILIIDPDSKAAAILSSRLNKEGYDVEIGGGVTKAAERIRDVPFDCVIMDVNLPEMTGYEAVSILKAIEPKVQIIMTATENSLELEEKVRKQDIFYYYIKSFDWEELKEAVRDVFVSLGKVKEMKEMSQPQKILVIDDDPGFTATATTILESKGYEVEEAHDSQEAMEKIERIKPDLILLDIMMERVTAGFALCYKLKHDPEMKKIPVLAISAISEETGFKFSPATDGEYFEADDFMQKPVKPVDLLKRVEKLLNG